jgi:hypothetical protein
MPRTQTRPGDVTGREKERLERENAAALEARRGEISLMAQRQAVEDAEPVDLTKGGNARPEPVAPGIEEVGVVDVAEQTKNLRVNTTLEDVTIGAGNHYTFEEGRSYLVPKHIYDHLDEKGYVWH